MEMQHTPGPWAADQFGLVTAGKNRLHIAQAMTTGMGKAADANAALIAAAPELLKALEAIVRSEPHALDWYRLCAARAAVSKAKGIVTRWDEYQAYLRSAGDADGNDTTRGGAPLLSFEQWLAS